MPFVNVLIFLVEQGFFHTNVEKGRLPKIFGMTASPVTKKGDLRYRYTLMVDNPKICGTFSWLHFPLNALILVVLYVKGCKHVVKLLGNSVASRNCLNLR